MDRKLPRCSRCPNMAVTVVRDRVFYCGACYLQYELHVNTKTPYELIPESYEKPPTKRENPPF